MTAYRYQALNSEGKLVKGVMEGDSERQVRSALRTQSMRPVAVSLANKALTGSGGLKAGFLQPRISTADFALLTRQLATLVQSSLPLDECLTAVAQQCRKPKIKGLLLQVRSRVA